jgi:chromosome partitioning protein
MMRVLAVIGQKGGSGKTTLAISLAVAASKAGKSVLIVDLDPQASACKWSDRREADAPAVIDAQPARLANALAKAKEQGIDIAIVDTPARIEQAAAEAAKIADLVLVPIRPSILDVETLATSADLIRGRTHNPLLVVLNAVPASGGRGEQARQAVDALGLTVCPQGLGQRVAVEYAHQLGLSATEYEPAGKAAEEIQQLYMSIWKRLDMSTRLQGDTQHEQKTKPRRNR